MGRRPSGIETDPTLVDRIAEAVQDGATPFRAATAEGVPERTFSRWMARGAVDAEQEADTPYAGLWLAITRAHARAVAGGERELRNPVTSGEDDKADGVRVTAIKHWLAGMDPDRWGQNINVRVRSEAVEHVLERLRTRLDPGTYEVVLRALAEDEGAGAAEPAGDDLH